MRMGFDKDVYSKKQIETVLKKASQFPEKLYLEFGGKLFDDYHASRVLPGFEPDLKIKILQTLKDKVEVIFCINANHIEHSKVRDDSRMSYEKDMLRQIESIRDLGIKVSSIVITLYNDQKMAAIFKAKLKSMGENVYIHYPTKGYPNDVETIVSEQGYGKNPYIKTTSPIVVVTAPGPCSGKLGTCLSNMYHEFKAGRVSGYAKFETFPVWNLPLKHPVNIAYEASTIELGDINMIDPYHLNAYKKIAVNYNRDIEVFPVLSAILEKITNQPALYKSPTDMGINTVASAIKDDKAVQEAAKQEIIRRYYATLCNFKLGTIKEDTVARMNYLLSELNLKPEKERKVVRVANETHNKTGVNNVAIQLPNGEIVVGKDKGNLSASAGAVINAIKHITGIADDIKLIPDSMLIPISNFKRDVLREKDNQLSLHDALMALSLSAPMNDTVQKALDNISKLYGCEAHASYMISERNVQILKKLGINITMEPQYKNGYGKKTRV